MFDLSTDMAEKKELTKGPPGRAQGLNARLAAYLMEVGAMVPKENEDCEKDEDVRLATLKSVFLLDESIGELGDLLEGWYAWREAPDAEWRREEIGCEETK